MAGGVVVVLPEDVVAFVAEYVGLSGPGYDGWKWHVGEACREVARAAACTP